MRGRIVMGAKPADNAGAGSMNSTDGYAAYLARHEGGTAAKAVRGMAEYYGQAHIVSVSPGAAPVDLGQADAKAIRSILEWNDPETGESRGRIGRNGRPFYEITTNWPKDFDVASLVNPDLASEYARLHNEGNQNVLGYLSGRMYSQVWKDGAIHSCGAGRFDAVCTTHGTSRDGDPELHTHIAIPNRVWCEGKWRSIDSSRLIALNWALQAMHDAKGVCDPSWRRVLASHGLTVRVDENGVASIPELERAADFMSKRRKAIKEEEERLTRRWRKEHPGQEPDYAMRRTLNQMAWARTRKAKDKTGEKAAPDRDRWWRELSDAGIDLSGFAQPRDVPGDTVRDIAERPATDEEKAVIAARAVRALQSERSAWSEWDVDRQLWIEISRSGLCGDSGHLDSLHAQAKRVAMRSMVRLSDQAKAAAPWVRSVTTRHVIDTEAELTGILAVRGAGENTPEAMDESVEGLDPGQAEAAAQICGTAALTVVQGAAGSGKTTMLAACRRELDAGGRRLLILTPSGKAAKVAARETGAEAWTVHKLLAAHGLTCDDLGTWTDGDLHEPRPGSMYALSVDDVIVVDEAGMLDQETALRLLRLADRYGCKVALVGDERQLSAVGRGGVLGIAARHARSVVEMTQIHRFHDPEWARVTLGIRDCKDPAAMASRLTGGKDGADAAGGHAVWLGEDGEVVDYLARAWTDDPGLLITCTTNRQADLVNETIQRERMEAGSLGADWIGCAGDGAVHAGDRIQTRLNDASLGVANRETWTVTDVRADGITATGDDGRSVRLPAGYVSEWVRLAYAVTTYGAQGATANASIHWADGSRADAADVYVGLTRGRADNRLVLTAADQAQARDTLRQVLSQSRADLGVAHASRELEESLPSLPEYDLPCILSTDGEILVEGKPGQSLRQLVEENKLGLARASLCGCDLSGMDLSGADLREADLSESNLYQVDFKWAVLDGATMRGANLGDSRLERAHLCEADLGDATMRGADMRGVCLDRADMSDADMSGADLSGASLRGSDLDGATMRGVDVTDADFLRARMSGTDLTGACLWVQGHRYPVEASDFDRAYADEAILGEKFDTPAMEQGQQIEAPGI